MRLLQRRPCLSIVVVVYRMPDQAEKTLFSLSPSYQQGVAASAPPEQRERIYHLLMEQNVSIRGELKPSPCSRFLYGTPHPAGRRFLKRSVERLSA